jgi:hypothetical protein
MVNEKFIVKLNGRDFVTYEGLLSVGHEIGIESIKVDLVQPPCAGNNMTAIAKATVIGKDGQEYTDYGDASPESVNNKIIPHICRMASTRAKARALRDFTNIGMTAFEELNPDDMEPELITQGQVNLLRKLSCELNVDINYDSLDKVRASQLINELLRKKAV